MSISWTAMVSNVCDSKVELGWWFDGCALQKFNQYLPKFQNGYWNKPIPHTKYDAICQKMLRSQHCKPTNQHGDCSIQQHSLGCSKNSIRYIVHWNLKHHHANVVPDTVVPQSKWIKIIHSSYLQNSYPSTTEGELGSSSSKIQSIFIFKLGNNGWLASYGEQLLPTNQCGVCM